MERQAVGHYDNGSEFHYWTMMHNQRDYPFWAARDFVFDEQLPEPGAVTARIHSAEEDNGAHFLRCLRQGAKTGLVLDCNPDELGRYPADLQLTQHNLGDLPANDRSEWALSNKLEIAHQSYAKDGLVFDIDRESDFGPAVEGADFIAFKNAWRFLRSVALFRRLLSFVGLLYGRRVGRDDPKSMPVSMDYLDAALVRVDFRRGVIYAPLYRKTEPWAGKIEDVAIFNKLAEGDMANGWGEERAQETPAKVVLMPVQREIESPQQPKPETPDDEDHREPLDRRKFIEDLTAAVTELGWPPWPKRRVKILQQLLKIDPNYNRWKEGTLFTYISDSRPAVESQLKACGERIFKKNVGRGKKHIRG